MLVWGGTGIVIVTDIVSVDVDIVEVIIIIIVSIILVVVIVLVIVDVYFPQLILGWVVTFISIRRTTSI